jgi:hypothetical protein
MPRASGSAGHRGLVRGAGLSSPPALIRFPDRGEPAGDEWRPPLRGIHDCTDDHEFIN